MDRSCSPRTTPRLFIRGIACRDHWLRRAILVLLLGGSLAAAAYADVRVQGRELFVNNEPFVIKGVCYSPTPAGMTLGTYHWASDPDTYAGDFALIKSMGANTIRIYDSSIVTRAALDAAYNSGLHVIMGYWVNPASDLSNNAVRGQALSGFLSVVNEWKDHPAVLMWSFGNEVANNTSSKTAWYTLLSSATEAAHRAEGPRYHPVTTSNAGIDDIGNDGLMTGEPVDVWGANIYRGASFGDLFSSMHGRTSRPFYVSEWGSDAYNGTAAIEDGDLQDACIRAQWAEIAGNLAKDGGTCLGGTLFEWSDEWWKGKRVAMGDGGTLGSSGHDTATDWSSTFYTDQNMNEEWWGIATAEGLSLRRTPRRAFYSLRALWNTGLSGAQASEGLFAGEVRNYPNPFVPGRLPTKIKFQVHGSPETEITVYDLAGGKVVALGPVVDAGAGMREADWSGKDGSGEYVDAGLYICVVKLRSGAYEETRFRKIAVVK